MMLVCGGVRLILGFLFDRDKDVEGDPIVEDENIGDEN